MKKTLIILLLPLTLIGQTKPSHNVKTHSPESWMVWQIKHVSQFIERFDYQKLPDESAFTDSTRQLYPREQYVRGLFNQEDARLTKGKINKYTVLVDEFLEQVCQKDSLHIGQQPVFSALAPCLVQMLDKTDTLFFSLKKYYRPDSASYWQVEGVKLPSMLQKVKIVASKDTIIRHYLEPNAHEVAFLPLLRSMVDDNSILRLVPDSLRSQKELQILETVIKEKKIVITVMLPPTIFLETPQGWEIQLNDFIRETDNSGWLITNLRKKNKKGK
jgi:ATP adenylyltransferase/5',5'''-P-1,P-4-tetraphosphate phosphorylase II